MPGLSPNSPVRLKKNVKTRLALGFARKFQARVPKLQRRLEFLKEINRNCPRNLKALAGLNPKEAAAEYVGERVERRVMQKTTSALLSKYFFRNEKLRRDVHRYAQMIQRELVRKDEGSVLNLSRVIATEIGMARGSPEIGIEFVKELLENFFENRREIVIESEKANH